MKHYTCPGCGHRFREIDAYCENWRVAAKSFGCPRCETFLRRIDNIVIDTQKVWITTIFTWFVSIALMYFANYHRDGVESIGLSGYWLSTLGLVLGSAAYPIALSLFRRFEGPNIQIIEPKP